MNFLYLVVLAIVIILLIGFIFKIIKNVLKVIIFLAILVNIAILVAGMMVYFDTKDFQRNFLTKSKAFFLVQDDRLAGGFRTTDFTDVVYFDQAQLDEYAGWINSKEYDRLRGTDYKVFIIDMLSFERTLETPVNITEMGITLDRAGVNELLGSDNTVEVLSAKLYETLEPQYKKSVTFAEFNQSMQERVGSDARLRGMLFIALFQKSISEDYLSFLITGIRSQIIKVFPETVMFSTIRYIPDFFIIAALEKR